MKRRSEKGQALVETAIVAPLFIFMLLGVLQMALVYHASYLLKYAAYRAARTGAMLHANHDAMRESAAAAILPVLSRGRLDKTGLPTASTRVDSATRFATRFNLVKNSDKFDVVICGPTKQHMALKDKPAKIDAEVEFDDPASYKWSGAGFGAVDSFERTKLRIQVQLYFELKIPFANYVIYQIWWGRHVAELMRMGEKDGRLSSLTSSPSTSSNDAGNGHRYVMSSSEKNKTKECILGTSCIYYMPLHENYPFRMQSNLYPSKEGFELPTDNRCWHYRQDGSDGVM